ncbi:hypothetical protein J19TS2_46810 [Cohnella xylanilytica]|uniref:DUF3139 domain-containing protein n=1 Tax=Cohnella xylanilytica TaxID=557555 RepID=A0A841U4I8_9BACL|nr:hypothetical protein [Cohnella xylanilytica]MBB6692904.1 hypothetical protein [Cohnella xylanilytica]GIO15126.1 hypothetical protein J19TS2_46810 [Cohnella xylanilytica]
MSKYKKAAGWTAAIVFALGLILQFPLVQRASARMTASVYAAMKHGELHLTYQSVEYSSSFGAYYVSFRDRDGRTAGFEVRSKRMPFFVAYDPYDTQR